VPDEVVGQHLFATVGTAGEPREDELLVLGCTHRELLLYRGPGAGLSGAAIVTLFS
jgi:hypothetical protein